MKLSQLLFFNFQNCVTQLHTYKDNSLQLLSSRRKFERSAYFSLMVSSISLNFFDKLFVFSNTKALSPGKPWLAISFRRPCKISRSFLCSKNSEVDSCGGCSWSLQILLVLQMAFHPQVRMGPESQKNESILKNIINTHTGYLKGNTENRKLH